MRKITVLIAAMAVMALSATSALATAPTVTISSPTNNQLLEYTSFPQTINVTGTVSRSDTSGGGGNDNLCGVQEFKVVVDDGVDATEIGTKTWSQGSSGCAITLDDWSFPYTITAPGVFTVTASGKRTGSEVGSDAVDFQAELATIVASFPAAPSVAGKLLAENGASHKYGSGRNGGNHIADVARHMGPGTDFDGAKKSDAAAYRAAVDTYLVENGAYQK